MTTLTIAVSQYDYLYYHYEHIYNCGVNNLDHDNHANHTDYIWKIGTHNECLTNMDNMINSDFSHILSLSLPLLEAEYPCVVNSA